MPHLEYASRAIRVIRWMPVALLFVLAFAAPSNEQRIARISRASRRH